MIPQISITSQRGILGIESRMGRYEIQSFRPEVNVDSTPSQFTADNGPGTLVIDHRDTDNALTGGRPEAFWQRIYSQYQQIAKDNIQQIVEKGNRMGDLTVRGNPMPDMALNDFIEGAPDLQVFGFASPMNTHFQYTPRDLNLQFIPGQRNMDIQVRKPEINYERGSVNYQMQQYPKVTITPPAIDIQA